MLSELNLRNSSTTRIIYPSFAQPLYFDIPFANMHNTPIEVDVIINTNIVGKNKRLG